MIERKILLPPEPSSAHRARRFVAAVLERQGLRSVAVHALLCTTELVTNAILHARTELTLLVRCDSETVRVEVRDGVPLSPPLSELERSLAVNAPGRRGEREEVEGDPSLSQAMTGRGWLLVSALASGYGVTELGRGKSAWFELNLAAGGEDADVHAEILPYGELSRPAEKARVVRMLDVPARLILTSEQHLADLAREAQLALSSGHMRSSPGGDFVSRLMDSVLERFADARSTSWTAAMQAFSEGRDVVTFEMSLPRIDEDDVTSFLSVLEEADELCGSGALLVMPAPYELARFRLWYLTEIVRQLRGEPPMACPFRR